MIKGTTYSHIYAKDLGLNIQESFQETLNYGFDLIRLGCYWNEIEKKPGEYDFRSITQLLDKCDKENQQVMVTIGMKAPRWPEFFIPAWLPQTQPNMLKEEVKRFVAQCVQKLQHYSCIRYWQVENEPMDDVGGKRIEFELLKEEVEVVRALDSARPIVVTMWGNLLSSRGYMYQIQQITDIVGIDLYYSQAENKRFFSKQYQYYTGPEDSDDELREIIEECKKPVWITELQAEPWEPGVVVPKLADPPSLNVHKLEENFLRAQNLGAQAILFWGFEYWLWKQKHVSGDLYSKGLELNNVVNNLST